MISLEEKIQQLNLLDIQVLGINISLVSALALIIIMATMGLKLKPRDFTQVFLLPKPVTLGLIFQLLMLPATALVLVYIFQPGLAVAAGIIIISCCPGGAPSNFFTFLAKGNIALSISLTVLSGVIVVFSLPLLVNFGLRLQGGQGANISLPVIDTMVRIFILVIAPVITGMAFAYRWPKVAAAVEPIITKFSFVILVLTVLVLLLKIWPLLYQIINLAWPIVVCLNLSMMATSYFVAKLFKLNEQNARTLCIETGVQNYMLAMVIALAILKKPEFIIAPILYLFTVYITVFTFIAFCRRSPLAAVDYRTHNETD